MMVWFRYAQFLEKKVRNSRIKVVLCAGGLPPTIVTLRICPTVELRRCLHLAIGWRING